MEYFNKIVRIGKGPYGHVFAHIQFNGSRLSITGVEGPTMDGNTRGGCGQIITHDWHITKYAPGWDKAKEMQFCDAWKNWHLNDMQAGTPAQTAYLRALPSMDYQSACETLRQADLNPDHGYYYGSAWLEVDVPLHVLEFLKSLPDTDVTPAWV